MCVSVSVCECEYVCESVCLCVGVCVCLHVSVYILSFVTKHILTRKYDFYGEISSNINDPSRKSIKKLLK